MGPRVKYTQHHFLITRGK
uniref:Uncharacterized protein n=1 Tax=Arundo donax TaxID=35708 RepID=A0A0A8Z0Y5_ARUDO